jgi:hypothetical protein
MRSLCTTNSTAHGLRCNDVTAAGRLRSFVKRLRECKQVLGSDYLLKELVREADVEWGHVLGERPYFDKEGSPPHPDDPYTFESVRKTLHSLMERGWQSARCRQELSV